MDAFHTEARPKFMRLCLKCQDTLIDEDWRCLSCGFSPTWIGEIPCFAVDLALQNDGMAADSHIHLDALQDQSFWFRARNRLIQDLARCHFPGARRVLEVGCGTGYVTRALRSALPLATTTASEIYANGLEYAKRRLGNDVEFLQMDA
ncbi:methyltransferase domain-containing protein [Tardiphaga sp. vice304]|nr:methyltransferase domain-containing protein [Tardiphaga sp. vice304]